MSQAIREAFSDVRGKISRRGIGFYICMAVWVAIIVCNLCNNKNVLNQTILGYFFYITMAILTSIFGDRNKKVGEPGTPPPPSA